MPKSIIHLAAALALAVLCSVAAGAQTVQSTPVPQNAKPDFSTMQFLVGTWNCSVLSARRPGPYTTTTVYTMDPTGYWILGKTTVHKAAWIPQEFTSDDRMTYDPTTSQWVDISYDDGGGYDVSTAGNWTGNTMVWHDVVYPKANNTATNGDTTLTKVSDTKQTSTMDFTEPGGRTVNVKTTCTKS
jgi:hypothetical protein